MLKVYYIKLSEVENREDAFFYPYVGEETRRAVQSVRHERVRRTKLAGESMVRLAIECIWGLPKHAYCFGRGEHGKPYVRMEGMSIFFNLSHSGEYVVAAFSDSEVGVDIERIGKPRIEVARRFFHPEEVRRLEEVGEERQKELFFTCWSVKESYLKYTGSGLTSPMAGFEMVMDGGEIAIFKEKERQPVFVRECAIDAGYKCFVCSADASFPEIKKFRFPG